MNAAVHSHSDGPVRTVTLQRPERRNAVDGPTAMQLLEAFEDFEADDASRVAVLTGAGGHFCAGADLRALADPALRNAIEPSGTAPGPMGPTRMAFSKPVIAAIEGYAVAGGLELALMCDLRVAARSATFGVFCRRWGVPLIDGGTVRLPRIIGMGRAKEWVLTGWQFDATESHRIGLVNWLCEDGQALEQAKELAKRVLKQGPLAIRVAKLALNASSRTGLETGLTIESVGQSMLFESQDKLDRMQKFLERKKS
jgi:enoyl-CoA hydratase